MGLDQKNKDLSDIQVLVIDDEVQVIRLLESVLLAMGVSTVIRAEDGAEALQMFEQHEAKIGLVICDWTMPKMSGLDVLREIRARNANIPFLMVTGKATEEAVNAAKELGVSAYVAKPFSLGEIERKVLNLLGGRPK